MAKYLSLRFLNHAPDANRVSGTVQVGVLDERASASEDAPHSPPITGLPCCEHKKTALRRCSPFEYRTPILTADFAAAAKVLPKRAGTVKLLHACTFLGTVGLMNLSPILTVNFFRTASGNEPVRKFLRDLTAEDRKLVGEDIKTAQFGWPVGMPLIRKLDTDLWEVRNTINDGIVRVLFTVIGSQMVLLHAFVKKSQKTPTTDLNTAKARLKQLKGAL